MARRCEICGKGPSAGYNVSHSHVRTKRRWHPNLQRVRGMVKGRRTAMRVCTKCMKAGKVPSAA